MMELPSKHLYSVMILQSPALLAVIPKIRDGDWRDITVGRTPVSQPTPGTLPRIIPELKPEHYP